MVADLVLSLDASWSHLADAYGEATEIPGLLKALKTSPGPADGPDAEPWFSLWSSLCHQGDVYAASYAALPHIVDIGIRAPGPVDFSFFQLPAAIEVARLNGRGPAVPDDLRAAYDEAVLKLADCVEAHRRETWDQDMLLSALAALAASKGNSKVAEAILNLDEDLIAKLVSLDFD